MANFPSFTFTAAGRAAITRSLSGKDVDRLIITKCVLGDGVYSGSIDSLKAVTSPKMTVTVSEYTDNGDGTSVTRFVYDNASLDAGFSHREMGIYAKNGDSGTELLLCYSNAGNQYSYIKSGTVDSVTKQRKATIPPQTFKFVLATGGSGSVDAVIDPKGYVDVEMLEDHNADTTAHPDIRQKLNSYLPLTGGTVTGTLNVPTPDATDNSTKVANTAFVQSAVDNKVSQLVNSAPETLNTLNELANALGNDPNFAKTVSTQIGQKADRTELNNNLSFHNTDPTAHKPIIDLINSNKTALTGTDEQIKSVLNTLLGTGAWDRPATNSIANIINLVGVGGIVAQRLEDNGFVKFANGLTIQWGSISNNSKDVRLTFPIAFSIKCFCGMVTAQKSTGYLTGSQCNAAVRIADTTGMVAIMYDNSNTGWYWIAIGI